MDAKILLATFQKGVQEIKARGYTEGEISQSLGLTPTYFSAVKHGRYPLTKEVYNSLVELYKDIEHLPKKQKQQKSNNTTIHGKIVDAVSVKQIASSQAQNIKEEFSSSPSQQTAIVPIVTNWQQRWPVGVPIPENERGLFLQSIAHLSAFEQNNALSERIPQGHYDPNTGITTVTQHEYTTPKEYFYTDNAQKDIIINIPPPQAKVPLPQLKTFDSDIDIDDIEKVEINDESTYSTNGPSLIGMAGKAAWLGVKGLFQIAGFIASPKPTPYELTKEYLEKQAYLQEQARLQELEQEKLERQQRAEEAENIRAKLEEMLQRRQKRFQE